MVGAHRFAFLPDRIAAAAFLVLAIAAAAALSPPPTAGRGVRAIATQSFDYVVVGAGSGGSVAAWWLACGPGRPSVALLESGTKDEDWWEPCAPGECGVWMPRVLGGGSAVNLGAYWRAAAADLPGWNASRVRAAYTALEAQLPRTLLSAKMEELFEPLRLLATALRQRVPGLRWRLDPRAGGTARISGLLISRAQPGGQQHGVIRVPSWQGANGQSALSKLEKITPYGSLISDASRRPPNLQVFHNTSVTRLHMDGGRVTGVQVQPEWLYFRVHQEVFLAAGALGTPRILHASGLSRRDELGQSSFPIQDQLIAWVTVPFLHVPCEARWPDISFSEGYRTDTEFPQLVVVFNSTPTWGRKEPHVPAEFAMNIMESCCGTDEPLYCLSFGIALLRPHRKGRLTLSDNTGESFADALGRIRMDVPTTTADVMAFRRVFQCPRGILCKVLQDVATMRMPGAGGNIVPLVSQASLLLQSDETFDTALREKAVLWNHPTGSLPLGEAVGHDFRLFGVDGVRVADNSIFEAVSGGTDGSAQLAGYLAAVAAATSAAAAAA